MSINKFEPYHGPVLSRIIKEAGNLNLILKPAYNKNSYFLTTPEFSDDETKHVGIFIKYSSKRLTPWRFSVYKAEQEELELFEKSCKAAFLILVCGNDGIACLNFDQIKEVLDDNFEEVEWISANRRFRKEYSIQGSNGKLSKKIPPSLFPEKIITEIKQLKEAKKKSLFSWSYSKNK
jgi:hypothetical protein